VTCLYDDESEDPKDSLEEAKRNIAAAEAILEDLQRHQEDRGDLPGRQT